MNKRRKRPLATPRSEIGFIEHVKSLETLQIISVWLELAWRGRERGLAVVAGVFLASLVITTVLSYGVGLSQIFFAESLDSEPFDAKIEFAREPVVGAGGYSNNTTVLESVCDELTQRSEIDDCTIVLGRQGIHGGDFSMKTLLLLSLWK